MAQALFRAAGIPRRLMPAAIALGTSTFTMSALPGTPAIQNAIPMPFFGTTPFAAPGLGIIASLIMLGFGLWWLARAEAAARRARRRLSATSARASAVDAAQDQIVRERATTAREFDPAEIAARPPRRQSPPIVVAAAAARSSSSRVNLMMSLVVLPRLDDSLSGRGALGRRRRSPRVGGVWSVDRRARRGDRRADRRQPAPPAGAARERRRRRQRLGAAGGQRREPGRLRRGRRGAAGLRHGARLGAGIGGGPLVSLAIATNVLAALTGSASGGLTIALDALGETYLRLAAETASIRRCCTASR